MRRYAIGLDIGVASVGWAVVSLDANENPNGILDIGTRIFDAAENPKTGASLAAPRREKRSMRRRLRRHNHRNERIRNLLLDAKILTPESLADLFCGRLDDIYSLRVQGLDRVLSPEEFARVLIHIAQRRGFKSNRKNPASKEDGKLLEAVSANQKRMVENGYRTVAEMMFKDAAFAEHKRNKGEEYVTTVTRDMVKDEVCAIFAAQRALGSKYAANELEEKYLEILLSQRSFEDGPGGDSPYGGNQIEKMIGKCVLLPEQPRAAKASYSFERFNLLQKINHIRLISASESVPLTAQQRLAIEKLAYKTEKVTFGKIRKELSIDPSFTFNMVNYQSNSSKDVSEEKTKFNYLNAYHELRVAVDKISKGLFASVPIEQKDAMGYALTVFKTSDKIRDYLQKAGVDDAICDALEAVKGFSKFGHLSVKACRALMPHLEKGLNYNEACDAAGLYFKGHQKEEKTFTLHPCEEDYETITSPVVKRAVSQSIKVINAIIRKQQESPVFINIELAREMAKDFDERNKAKKSMEENRALNEKIKQEIIETYHHPSPTGLDIVKLKLYKEQDGRCAYSLNSISAERLFEPNYVEIDHIVPYSISFDDTYKNKVLVLAKENREKGNRLPMQYLSGKRREDFIVWVSNNVHNYKKRSLLLKEKIDEDGFKERNLQDTKTMSVFLKNYLADNLLFAPSERRKKRVTAVNGAVTAYMRKRWGITKIREDGDLHHAVDALVIACTTDGMIQQVSRYSAFRECEYVQGADMSAAVDPKTGEVLKEFPYPWPHFHKELELRMIENPEPFLREFYKLPLYHSGEIAVPEQPVFVSRMPHRKVTGPAHMDTVRSPKEIEQGFVISKKALTDLKLKNGEILNYYDPQSDTLLYQALKERLVRFGGNAEEAFREPFYKPKSDGTQGPLVRKVKLKEPTTLSVPVHDGKGVAANDSMVRVDVFRVENDGYYLVPIYVADTLKDELPNRAIAAGKPYSLWKEMREEDFVFSLYPNDLICATHRSLIKLSLKQKNSTRQSTLERKSFMLYYISASISTGAITAISNDGVYKIDSLGVKTLESLEKYEVDVLGNYHKVKKEVRQRFHGKRG